MVSPSIYIRSFTHLESLISQIHPRTVSHNYAILCQSNMWKHLPQLAMSVISLISQWSSSYPLLSPAAYRSFPGLSALTPRGELDAGPLHRGCGGRHHAARARAERGAGVSSASGGENSSHEVDVAIDMIYIYIYYIYIYRDIDIDIDIDVLIVSYGMLLLNCYCANLCLSCLFLSL